MDKDYKLAEHLIAHLQQDDVLAPMVCPTVWDDQDQIDAINRAAMGRPGSVAVTPAGYVPLLEMGVNAPMVRMHAVLAVSCFARAFLPSVACPAWWGGLCMPSASGIRLSTASATTLPP